MNCNCSAIPCIKKFPGLNVSAPPALMVIELLLFADKFPIVKDSVFRTVTSTLLFMVTLSPGVSAIRPPDHMPELDQLPSVVRVRSCPNPLKLTKSIRRVPNEISLLNVEIIQTKFNDIILLIHTEGLR